MISHLESLMEVGREINEKDENLPAKRPTYDKGYWTGLKLIALKYYVKPYLNILGPRKKLAYVDLLAGPGLNRLGDRQVPIPGSPLIPMTLRESQHDYARYILVEHNKDYCGALEQRVSQYPENSTTLLLCQNVNSAITAVIDALEKDEIEHSLVFIDPEGLEFHWNSLTQLIDAIDCDIIVNFPSAGLARCLGKPDTYPTVARFLGIKETAIPGLESAQAIGLYRRALAHLGLNISMEIEISSGMGFGYHLIPAVRRTWAGSPWFGRIWGELKKRVDRTGAEFLDIIAQQIDGVLGSIS